jgi:hypothetical protein
MSMKLLANHLCVPFFQCVLGKIHINEQVHACLVIYLYLFILQLAHEMSDNSRNKHFLGALDYTSLF